MAVARPAELHFTAMGCDAAVFAVEPPAGALEQARARIDQLERRWSRFLPHSEISRMNRAPGRPVVVSKDTFVLVQRAVDAWQATGGRFDPTVFDAVVAAGYDRSHTRLAKGDVDDAWRAGEDPAVRPAPGCAGIVLDPVIPSIVLPPGVHIDPGGIGKGLAADLVAQHLIDLGAKGACVNMGGDVRVTGEAPVEAGWVISVEHPADPETEIARVALADGAVVTSSRMLRTWERNGVHHHHLIDPASGRQGDTGLMAVTVVAGEAWWAEVLAKAAFLVGPAHADTLLTSAGATGLFVDDAGGVHLVAGMKELLV